MDSQSAIRQPIYAVPRSFCRKPPWNSLSFLIKHKGRTQKYSLFLQEEILEIWRKTVFFQKKMWYNISVCEIRKKRFFIWMYVRI